MTVTLTHAQIEQFKHSFPCSGIPELSGITFHFSSNGDLVDIVALDWETGTYIDSSEFDGDGLLALSHEAQKIGSF